ncbi:MAG: LysM peptidoglycan-binding domain-containing protein [Tepidisphaeraceae bacterium]
MVVLRKEIKMGIGAGLAILGIAGVYGLMASLSGSHDQTAEVTRGNLPDDAVPGLPPVEDKPAVAPVKPPEPIKTADANTAKSDPFSESYRNDGNKGDVWSSALSTGRIEDVKAGSAAKGSDPIVDRAPVAKKDSPKLVDAGSTFIDSAPKHDSATSKSEPKASFAGGSTYKVQAGDTFSTISEKVYGSRKFFNVLVKANPQVNPGRMKIGQEIAVPPKDAVASVGGAVETSVAKLTSPIDASRQYRIASGDTLSKIASKLYGRSVMWQAIYDANKAAIGPDEAKLKVGMVLNLPEKPVR